MKSFKDLGLINDLLRAVEGEGYTTPTPIQEQVIPLIMEGNDVMAGSQTGTGKTAGFVLPIMHRLMDNPTTHRNVRALILTPTRELAAQVGDNVKTYGKFLPLKARVIYGGVNIRAQFKALRSGADIVVATPGRLLDHVSQGTIDLSQVEVVVLDEGDRMLDMGFINDIRQILTLLPENRQSLLFSATFSPGVRKLASTLLRSPKTIEAAVNNTPSELITHVIHPVDNRRKHELLSFLISSQDLKQVLVFTRTKHGANCLSEQLEQDGISSTAIHGNKTQAARTKALEGFKRKTIRVLVATDIAARGLDIDELPHVVNFELPNMPEDYVHRIGRTGRAGNKGEAISLVCIDEHKLLNDIERLLKLKIPHVVIEGFEPDPSIRAVPIYKGRGGGRGGPSQGGNRFRGNRDDSRGGYRGERSGGFRSNRDDTRGDRAAHTPRGDAPYRAPRDSNALRSYQPRGESQGERSFRGSRDYDAPRSFKPKADGGRPPFSGPRDSDAPRSFKPRADGDRPSFREQRGSDLPRSFKPRGESQGERSFRGPRDAEGPKKGYQQKNESPERNAGFPRNNANRNGTRKPSFSNSRGKPTY